LEEPVANLRSNPWTSIANLDQNGVAFRNCRDLNGSSEGHDIERIYEQVDENSLDPLTVQCDHKVSGDVLNDLHRLSLGGKGHFVYRAGY
jgi:hypothetical protein